MHTFTSRFCLNTGSFLGLLLGAKHTNIEFFFPQSNLITMHIHKVNGCSSGSSATPGHLCTELHQRLADTCSVGRVGSSALRCHASPHEVFVFENKPQEVCAEESENLFSRGSMEFDHDASNSCLLHMLIHSLLLWAL